MTEEGRDLKPKLDPDNDVVPEEAEDEDDEDEIEREAEWDVIGNWDWLLPWLLLLLIVLESGCMERLDVSEDEEGLLAWL